MKNVLMVVLFFVCYAVARSQSCTVQAIDSNYVVKFTCRGSLQVNGKIDDTSTVELTSLDSNIVILDRIDRGSKVIITAKKGNVTIGKKIDGKANVTIICRGDIIIQGKIDGGAICDFYTETGKIIVQDKVAGVGTMIRFHSLQPPTWGSSVSITPVAY